MKYRILQKKLLFLHHVTTLPEDSLAKEILSVQKRLSLPGLYQECEEWLVKFDITTRVESYTKHQWKNLIKKRIREENKDDLLSQIKYYKKLNYEHFKDQEFKVQPYLGSLTIHQSRTRFKLKSMMTPTIQMNFPSNAGFTRDMWMCSGCSTPGDVNGKRDTQSHVMICSGYAVLREGKDLSQDKDMVEYFQNVIKLRQQDSD